MLRTPMPAPTNNHVDLPSELALERIITLQQAAELSGISPDGWRRHYPHLIRRLSPRRVGVKLRDALSINQETTVA